MNIVVFYPNINIKKCLSVCRTLYEEYIRTLEKEPDNIHESRFQFKQLELFYYCLHLGNK